MSRTRRKVNLPLIEIIVASLVIHIVGLLILGGITIFNQINVPEPEMIAPVVAEVAPPVMKMPVQLTPKQQSAPTNVIAMDIKQMPLKDFNFDMPTVDQRVGVGTGGFGNGMGGGNVIDLSVTNFSSFVGIKEKSESVLFIVDYSISMKEEIKGSKTTRFTLLKQQLTASLEEMSDQMIVSLIFFSGPAWVAGESEAAARKNYSFTPKDWHSHRPKDLETLTKPVWNRMTKAFRSELIQIVNKEKITGGTVWSNPLRLAMMLDPAPEVIYFLTDGATSDEDVKETLALVGEWKRANRKLRIHTIALGEPKASDAMRRIANLTGGKFRLIESLDDIKKADNNNG
ncbi:vWA domain-containing protein [Cerasicoccus arenae]|uniref:VWFA domain-containing protein n=1 Tax=Cerasicoccus arenae TaxID=424488 RepID=A0A8J3GEU7_9BACT|nr:vWA domain-containing protein [Cerasicoccus arenae]MBK1858547.1 VWA domain-containing protein [Cerasicoccus arenae]GHC06215.1 hypothetical protein GCM10007047_24130 [Cerasicoccus arenae]